MQSLVVPLLPTIGEQLGISANAAGWVLTANLLAAAVATPVLGRLGDAWGERPVALGVLTAMSAGTLLALVTSSLDRKSTRLNSSHANISYDVFCLKKKFILIKSHFQKG